MLLMASQAVRAQPGVDTVPENICEDVKVFDFAQKKCVDPGPGQEDAGRLRGGAGDVRPSWRLPSFIEELACSCAEKDCSCGRKCDCKPPKPSTPAGGCAWRVPGLGMPCPRFQVVAFLLAGTNRSTACATACCATADENARASWPRCATMTQRSRVQCVVPVFFLSFIRGVREEASACSAIGRSPSHRESLAQPSFSHIYVRFWHSSRGAAQLCM